MGLGEAMTFVFGAATLLGNILLGVLLVLWLVDRTSFRAIMVFFGERANLLGFIIAGGSMVGSIVYSEVVGYPACILCWVSRIFMYPLPFLYALALYRKENVILPYTFLLSLIGAIFGLYQWGKEMVLLYGGVSLPCPAVAGLPPCDRIYILEYGYITIPMLALNAFIWAMLVSWAGMKYASIR